MKPKTEVTRPTLTPEELETLRRRDEAELRTHLGLADIFTKSGEWSKAALHLEIAMLAARRRAGT